MVYAASCSVMSVCNGTRFQVNGHGTQGFHVVDPGRTRSEIWIHLVGMNGETWVHRSGLRGETWFFKSCLNIYLKDESPIPEQAKLEFHRGPPRPLGSDALTSLWALRSFKGSGHWRRGLSKTATGGCP